MELYGEIDLHSNNCVIVILDEKGDKLFQKEIERGSFFDPRHFL